jgi:mono/diheme cytochrome c family protein
MTIGRVTVVGAGLLVLLGAAPAAAADDVAAVARGKQLFTEQKCALCHSIAGVGNKNGPMEEALGKLKADEIKKWITSPKEMATATKATRKPPMKTFPNLSAEDVDALVAYLQSVKKA